MPDLHTHNFSAGKQRVDDSGAYHMAEVFFEMKTYTACDSRYNKNNSYNKNNKRTKKLTAELKKSPATTTTNSKNWIKYSWKRL